MIVNRKKMINEFSILSGELNYFLAVFQQKSINAAARKLGADPGNISRAIHKIEQATHEKLFIRHKKGLTPTFFGTRFYSSITQAQGAFSNHMQSDDSDSEIRIGFSSAIGHTHFAPSMTKVLLEKKLKPVFTIESSMKLIELLQKREIDFALVHSPVKFPGLIARAVGTEGIALASKGTDPTDTLVLHPDMLAAERIIYSIRHAKRWSIKDYFVIAKMLEHNSALMGLVPESLLKNHPSLKRLKIFSNEGKITALTWPGSSGIQLLESIERE